MSPDTSREFRYYVGVHHKTGNYWMKQLSEEIGRRLGLSLIDLPRPPSTRAARASDPRTVQPGLLGSTVDRIRAHRRVAVLDEHSLYAEVVNEIPGMRGVHIIRDPRDVLLSATFYHLRSDERWLHRPMPQFDGMTYQEKLRTLGTIREAVGFELRHQTRRVISEMAAFPRLARVPTITYESLMAGDVLAAFEAMFSSLGFPSDALGVALECAREESIVLNPDRRRQAHVRSGKIQQWRQTFDRELAELFFAEAGDALVTLGYEPDGAWVAGLPDRHPALDESLPTRQTAATLKL